MAGVAIKTLLAKRGWDGRWPSGWLTLREFGDRQTSAWSLDRELRRRVGDYHDGANLAELALRRFGTIVC